MSAGAAHTAEPVLRGRTTVRRPARTAPGQRKDHKMSLKDKAEATSRQLAGAAEEKIGTATGNDRLAGQGREHQAEGRLKEAAAEVKETVAGAAEKAKEAAQDVADKAGRLFKK